MFKTALIFLTVVALNSCSVKVRYHDDDKQAMTYIKSNMEFLASDELQGRESSTFGGYAAGKFLTNQFKQYGIEPFGEDGYFQYFKLQSVLYTGSRAIFQKGEELDSLEYLQDYYVYSAGNSVEKSPIVFVGYGMIDSANNINDYDNIDAKNKTVLVLRGVPSGYEGPRSASWTLTKYRNAIKAGANSCIVIFSDKTMKSWNEEIQDSKKERIGRIRKDKTINTIILDSLSTKKLFNMQSKTYAEVRSELENGLIEKGAVLKETITWQLNSVKKEHTARNIIGILKGSDPSLKNEYVTIGGHYDHVGIKNGQVYNGADDNASGTTAVLECARQLATKKDNKRPILFCLWDAEEKGLLGSAHYANTHENLEEITVNINLDMVGREHEDTLSVIGSGKLSSEFFSIVEDANKHTTNFVFDYTYDDENHPENLYRRSDHWSFAKLGVPVVFLFDDHDGDYHTPGDDANKINYLKIKKVTDLAIDIALEVANLDHKLKVDNANISGMDFIN